MGVTQRGILLARNPQSKDEALEALDFIVNVLKEHEKDLDKLIGDLATVTEQLGDKGELNSKIEKVEEKLGSLQSEVSNLIGCISTTPKQAPLPETSTPTSQTVLANPALLSGPSLVFRCKQWEDFLVLASKAQTISFSLKDEMKNFQIDALKGNQIISYGGPIPAIQSVLKSWLSKHLNIPEQAILEGALSIS